MAEWSEGALRELRAKSVKGPLGLRELAQQVAKEHGHKCGLAIAGASKDALVAYITTEDPAQLALAPIGADPIEPEPVASDDAAALATLKRLLGGSVDPEAVRAIAEAAAREIAEAAAKVAAEAAVAELTRVVTVEIRQPNLETKRIEGAHASLAAVLDRLNRAVVAGYPKNVLMRGPAGTGKTTLAESVAEALGAELVEVSCSEDSQPRHFFGRKGLHNFEPTAWLNAYESERPTVILLDEFDALLPNVGISLNAPLANGHFGLPERQDAPRVNRGPGVVVLAAANTYGTGPDPIYCGRNALDGATLDRWEYVDVGYDGAIEERIASTHGCRLALKAIRKAREAINEHRLRRTASTRSLLRVAGAVAVGAHKDGADVVRAELCERGWTVAELGKAGF